MKPENIDQLAAVSGGYVLPIDEQELAYTKLFFELCKKFGIQYSSATPKERKFIDEVTRVTWEKSAGNPGAELSRFVPAFSS